MYSTLTHLENGVLDILKFRCWLREHWSKKPFVKYLTFPNKYIGFVHTFVSCFVLKFRNFYTKTS